MLDFIVVLFNRTLDSAVFLVWTPPTAFLGYDAECAGPQQSYSCYSSKRYDASTNAMLYWTGSGRTAVSGEACYV